MRRISSVLSLSLALLVAGCINDSIVIPTGPPSIAGGGDAIQGTYTLGTVNGSSLPWTYFTSGADTYVLLDDTFTLTSGGTWTETWHERHTVDGVATAKAFSDAGTFTNGTTRIVFTSTTPGSIQTVFESAFSSGTLTMPGQGSPGGPIETMVYMK